MTETSPMSTAVICSMTSIGSERKTGPVGAALLS